MTADVPGAAPCPHCGGARLIAWVPPAGAWLAVCAPCLAALHGRGRPVEPASAWLGPFFGGAL